MKSLEISKFFNVDDIRKVRDYNSQKHIKMSSAEIIADTKAGAAKVLNLLKKK